MQNIFSIWKKRDFILIREILYIFSNMEEQTQFDICRGASMNTLEHSEWTSLICIILTTSVASRPVFRETRASSVHNSTNIGNCSANWNSSPPPVPPLAIRASVESSLSYSHLGEILPSKLFHVESSLSTLSLSN